MRLTQTRIISQVFFFALFLFFAMVADLRYLKGYPVSLFLEIDPLVAFANALSVHEIYMGLLWSLVIIIPTLLLGRFFCGWVCPYGTLHHFVGWIFNRRSRRQKVEVNRYRPMYRVKYLILAGMLVAAAFGSLQIGLLDPICLFTRSMATALAPGVNQLFPGTVYIEQHDYTGAWVIGWMLVFLVAMNVVIPRWFCRTLCPLGALMGVLSRLSLWRIERDPHKCTHCNQCAAHCEGACDPHLDLRKAECFVCFNCVEDCPTNALAFRFLPGRADVVPGPQVPARRAVLAGLGGLLFYAWGRSSGAIGPNFNPKAIRPPGAVAEPEFLARCLKCDECLRVCPTGVLQPAGIQAGVEGFWTPILNMKMGWCELNCTLCGQVCPTGAIQRITIEEKLGLGTAASHGPVKLGTAFFDRGRCLPWAMDTSCVVCQEVCPVSPKAIFTREEKITRRDGTPATLQRPYLDPALCIGCGICEHECPVKDQAAVRVTAVGETRSRERGLLMRG